MVVLHPSPLTLLAGDDALGLQLGQWTVLFFFHHTVHVLFVERQELLLRGLLCHWNVDFVTQVTSVVELHAPSELVAEDLGDFEMRFDFSTQDLFKVFLFRKKTNKIFLTVIELTGRKLEVDDKVGWLVHWTSNGGHLDEASINYRVHRHSQQIYHNLDEVILFHSDKTRNVI